MESSKFKQYVLGIDPGKHGGAVLINMDNYTDQVHIPTKVKDGRVDVLHTVTALEPYKDGIKIAFIEDVHAIFGSSASATFEFGHAAGALYGAVQALLGPSVTIGYIQPKMWQKVAWDGVTPIKGDPVKDSKTGKQKILKSGKLQWKTDTKATSSAAAHNLFPGVSFVPPRCRNEHDGLIDAALIAYTVMPSNMKTALATKKKSKKTAKMSSITIDDGQLYIGPAKEK